MSLVTRDGMGAVVTGMAVGVGAALAARQWLGALLFQTSPSDPKVIAATMAGLLVVAVLATVLPTARALRRNPAEVLRVE